METCEIRGEKSGSSLESGNIVRLGSRTRVADTIGQDLLSRKKRTFYKFCNNDSSPIC